MTVLYLGDARTNLKADEKTLRSNHDVNGYMLSRVKKKKAVIIIIISR